MGRRRWIKIKNPKSPACIHAMDGTLEARSVWRQKEPRWWRKGTSAAQ
jgi:hypothetical protein